MLTYAKRSAAALLVVGTLSLSVVASSTAAIAQTAGGAQAEDSAAVLAAKDFLQSIGYRAATEAKFAAIAQTKIALKIMLEREPALEDQVAKIYAARFTAEELREASSFHRTATGGLYRSFNREMSANPFTTPEIYRSEIGKRFTSQQRAEVFIYLNGGVGQKMQRMLPDLGKAEKEVGEQWGRQTQEEINQAVRSGEQVS